MLFPAVLPFCELKFKANVSTLYGIYIRRADVQTTIYALTDFGFRLSIIELTDSFWTDEYENFSKTIGGGDKIQKNVLGGTPNSVNLVNGIELYTF